MAKTSSTPDALSAISNILDKVRDEGVDPGELAWAKESIINKYVFSFATSNRIVTRQMMLEYDGLPDNYLTNYTNNIEKVAMDDVRNAARYLSDTSRVVLVLGDEEKFSRPLTSFGNFHRTESDTGD